MDLFDIGLLVVLLMFVWKGFRAGLIGAIGGFLGVIVGIWAGAHYMEQAGEYIMQAANFDNQYLAGILGFIAIFVAINIIVSIIVSIVNRIFHIIPFIDLVNKLMGGIVGLIAGSLAVASLVYLLSIMPISATISNAVDNSQVAIWAMKISVVIQPFIPEAIKSLQNLL